MYREPKPEQIKPPKKGSQDPGAGEPGLFKGSRNWEPGAGEIDTRSPTLYLSFVKFQNLPFKYESKFKLAFLSTSPNLNLPF